VQEEDSDILALVLAFIYTGVYATPSSSVTRPELTMNHAKL